MEFKEALELLNTNKESSEVKEFVGSYLESESGKKLMQPKLDSYFNKGLTTWKEKTLPSIIQEEVAKANPEETSEQKRIRELEEKLMNQERNAMREKLKNQAITSLDAKGLPTQLANHLVLDSEEVVNSSISVINEVWQETLNKEVDKRLKGVSPKQAESTKKAEFKGMTQEKLLNMHITEATKYKRENPEEYKKIMGT